MWVFGLEYFFLEHAYIFENSTDIQEKVYDMLDILYQIEISDYDDNHFLPNTYNFGLTVEELFLKTPRDRSLTLEDVRKEVLKSTFLSINRQDQIVCEDISNLRACCYKSRRKKEILRQEGI